MNDTTSIKPNINQLRWLTALRKMVQGSTWKEAGEAIGVGEKRAKDLVLRIMRYLTNSARARGIEVPEHDYWIAKEARARAAFWLEQADYWEKEIERETALNEALGEAPVEETKAVLMSLAGELRGWLAASDSAVRRLKLDEDDDIPVGPDIPPSRGVVKAWLIALESAISSS